MVKGFSPYNIVKLALTELKENERRVITGRFGIDAQHQTLSAIGKDLKLSRERVRQIEKDALRKIANSILSQHKPVIDKVVAAFVGNGGVTAGNKIAEKYLEDAHRGDANQYNSLNLIFFVMPQLRKIKKTRELEEGWVLASISKDEAVKVINDWVSHLQGKKQPQTLDVLIKNHPNHQKYQVAFLSELPSISKKIVMTEDGVIGLSGWKEVNPKNIRDKIYYILRKNHKPMHFGEIAECIKRQGFDRKGVVQATVHNELIADNRFVLVGRGIYALSEWGYKPGTVLDVIVSVFGEKDRVMNVDEIVEAVLAQRMVRKSTILINLKTKSQFKRVGDSQFSLA